MKNRSRSDAFARACNTEITVPSEQYSVGSDHCLLKDKACLPQYLVITIPYKICEQYSASSDLCLSDIMAAHDNLVLRVLYMYLGAVRKYPDFLLFLKFCYIFSKILFQSIPHLCLYSFAIFVGAFVFPLQTMK